jgi:hypothetical protein
MIASGLPEAPVGSNTVRERMMPPHFRPLRMIYARNVAHGLSGTGYILGLVLC